MIKKWEEKHARKKFKKNTRIGDPKNVGEKSSQKSAKKNFFNKHMNIVTKNGGKKNREKIFTRNTRISRAKNDGKKSSGKSAKTRFFIKTRIS